MPRSSRTTSGMRGYRIARRRINHRLVRAHQEGRLEQELRVIEREAREGWAKMETASKSRHKAKVAPLRSRDAPAPARESIARLGNAEGPG